MPIIGRSGVQAPPLVDLPLELFGSLVTELQGSDLPPGSSPDCQDMDFQPGAVFTRAGLTAMFGGQVTGNVNYTQSFALPNLNLETLILDGSGNFSYEDTTNAPGVLIPIQQVKAGCYGQSVTQFGREYIAYSDSKFGIDIPRQWDGTYFDRVSQVGPGSAPVVVDTVATLNVTSASQEAPQAISFIFEYAPNLDFLTAAAPVTLGTGAMIEVIGAANPGYDGVFAYAPTVPAYQTTTVIYPNPVTPLPPVAPGGTVQSSFVTLNTALAHGLIAGQSVIVAGVGAGYNGTWTVASVPTPTSLTFFSTLTGLGPLGAGGTVELSGNITAGVHQVVQLFLTRQGYLTRPSFPTTWTAAGGKSATVTNLAIGPANVVARILAFTAAGGDFFFYIPIPTTGSLTGTVVRDNSSQSFIVDFTDATLLASTSIDSAGNNLFALDELGECLGVIAYSSRMFWWGERNKLQNLVNMTFDGGFSLGTGPGGGDVPLGWSADTTNGNGGTRLAPGYENFGFAYSIRGTALDTTCGMISQSVYQDFYSVPILLPNTLYSIRFKVQRTSLLGGSAALKILLTSPTTGLIGEVTLAASTMQTSYQEYIIAFSAPTGATISPDAVLEVYLDLPGTALGQGIDIDDLQLFPTNTPYLTTSVRASYVDNPESFDGVTGRLGVGDLNGQAVTCAFLLRDNLYLTKQNSLFSTEDNGQTEPSQWSISTISRSVGTPSVHGVAIGEEWAIIASQFGLYIFNGNEPMKMSQGIQPNWDSINWQYGSLLWTVNDVNQRRFMMGVPTNGATSPNKILMMNYKEINSSSELASQAEIRVSYSGKMLAVDLARKWCPWNISANCGALIQRQNGAVETWFGNNAGTNRLYKLDSSATSDDGNAINSYYSTYFFASRDEEDALQLGHHRHFYGYMVLSISGTGTLMTTYQADSITSTRNGTCPIRILQSDPGYDMEIPLNYTADRLSFKFQTNAVGQGFSLTKMVVTMSADPWILLRGRV